MSKSAEATIKANLAMNAGKQKAQAAKDKSAKAKALKSSGKKGSSRKGNSRGGAKSRAVGKARKAAGKVAAGRAGGFGCRVNVHKNGGKKGNIAGALNYVEMDKKEHEIIYSTCGREREQIEQAFEALKKLRPDIDNNVGHFSISLSHNSGFDETRWPELVEYAMRELDIDPDNHAAMAVIHNDADPSIRDRHIHCVFSRIGYDSTCHDGNKLGYYASAVAEKIEKEFNLNLTPRDDASIGRKAPSIAQLKEFERTGKLPKMMEIQNAVDVALATNPKNYEELKKALKPLKVDVHLNEQIKDGKPHLAGILYSMDDFKIPASKLGSKYGKYLLEKKGVLYEPSRANESESISQVNRAIEPNNEYAKDIELRKHGENGAELATTRHSLEQPSREQRVSDEQVINRNGRSVSDARPNAQNSGRLESAREPKAAQNDSNLGGGNDGYMPAAVYLGELAEATAINTERRSDPRSRKNYYQSYAFIKATEQIKALGVQDLEISIMLPANQDKPDEKRKMLKRLVHASNFHDHFGFFQHKNLVGCDIYIQPNPNIDHALVVLDDLMYSSIEELKADGIEPCAIVESSPNNWQAWIRLSDKPLDKKVRLEISRKLTIKYEADSQTSGSARLGRICGFRQLKEEHLNAVAKSPYVKLTETRAGVCSAGPTLVKEVQDALIADERIARIKASVPAHQSSQNGNLFFRAQAKKILAQFGNKTDLSRLDFMCAKNMAYQGFADSLIACALQDESPDIEARHGYDYINRTIAAVHAKLSEERNKATKDESERKKGLNNTVSDTPTI